MNYYKKNIVSLLPISLAGCSLLLSGCMTSSKQEQLQTSINQLQSQVSILQGKITSRDTQMSNEAINSQGNVQNITNQLQITQGIVDELKMKLKRIEESSENNNTNADNTQNTNAISNNTQNINQLQRKIARLELITSSRLSASRMGHLPAHIKNISDVNKILTTEFEQGSFKNVISTATQILNAKNSTDAMMKTAVEFRAEAHFQTKDYRGAALDFATYADLYSNSSKYARVLLLTGDSYVYLKNNAMASSYYQECAKAFSNTPEGKAALSRLGSLTALTANQG